MSGESSTSTDGDRDVVLSLPDTLRDALKDPFGPLFTDAKALLETAGEPVIAVGDMVTYHLLEAGRVPDVALIDERTERSAVTEAVRERLVGPDATTWDHRVTVANPAGTLTVGLLAALREALERDGPATVVVVEGEEDLGTLPALVLAPTGGSVVYGQPGEGMVLVTADAETTDRARSILSRMDGEQARAWDILGI